MEKNNKSEIEILNFKIIKIDLSPNNINLNIYNKSDKNLNLDEKCKNFPLISEIIK